MVPGELTKSRPNRLSLAAETVALFGGRSQINIAALATMTSVSLMQRRIPASVVGGPGLRLGFRWDSNFPGIGRDHRGRLGRRSRRSHLDDVRTRALHGVVYPHERRCFVTSEDLPLHPARCCRCEYPSRRHTT